MRKTIIGSFLLLVSLFLLTACGGTDQQTTTSGAFRGGTTGVTTVFEPFGVEEGGLYTIFDSETFPLEVTVRNQGEYEVQPGDVTVKILGPTADEFSGVASWEKKNQGVLDIISDIVPLGGEETISFASDAEYNQEINGLLDREFFANIEYKYQTYILIPEVCLKEDLTDSRVCVVAEAKTFAVSGAPLTATSVVESSAGKGIMNLNINIKNAGTGRITKIGDKFGVYDRFTFSIDDPDWECKSAGKVNEARLTDGEALISCKLKTALEEDTLATKQVKITLDYMYRDLIQETLRIKESAK